MDDTSSSSSSSFGCCHRNTYIYLYPPKMNRTTVSTRCLIGWIIVLCLAAIVILLGMIYYHRSHQQIQLRLGTVAKRQDLPDFVNETIDPCEDFYSFICQKWKLSNKTNVLHDHLMSSEDEPNFIQRWYQTCQTSESDDLVDEMKMYFDDLRSEEPYRSFLTLYPRQSNRTTSQTYLSFIHNPFFTLISNQWNNSVSLVRQSHRSLPSITQIFTNTSQFDPFALKELIEFEKDYEQLFNDESTLIQFYESKYDEDSLIIQRILSYPSYDMCNAQLNQTNGFDKFIFLLKEFLRDRLKQFNTKLIDQQITLLSQINDNHTLVTNLRRIYSELKMIEKILSIDRQRSCILKLCEDFLDRRIKYSELPFDLYRYVSSMNSSSFVSNDWPYLAMLSDRLLKKTSLNTLVNYMYFHLYRQIIYPYYQPHLKEPIVYSTMNFSSNDDQQCSIENCFDILNCYHPSILNELTEKENQVDLDEKKSQVENLLNRIRILIEQSDYLYFLEKRSMLEKLNQIEIRLGHFSSLKSTKFPTSHLTTFSYLDLVQILSALPSDHMKHSYDKHPLYYSRERVLFLPYAFLLESNDRSFDYSIVKLILTILRQTIQSDPFHIECFISSSDDDLHVNDEDILYLFFRSKFLSDEQIVVDEYLWPYMSSNRAMRRFLIDYTASNYCSLNNGKELIYNHHYLHNDIDLLFHCQKKKSIEQMNCHVI